MLEKQHKITVLQLRSDQTLQYTVLLFKDANRTKHNDIIIDTNPNNLSVISVDLHKTVGDQKWGPWTKYNQNASLGNSYCIS